MSDAVAIRRRAEAALDLRRPAEAQRLLAELLAGSPDDAWANALMARAMIDSGASPSAWRRYTDRAAARAPADVSLLVEVSEMSRRAGDVAAARWYIDRALAVSPDDVGALNVLSLVQVDQGDSQAALRTSRTVAGHLPDNPSVLVAHGMALSSSGRLAEAQAQYIAALRIDPHHVYALNNLATERLRCGDLDRAARLLHAAINEDPHERMVRLNFDVVGANARALGLARLMLAVGLALALGYANRWVGAAAGSVVVAWTVRDLLLLPVAVRRRLLVDPERADVFWFVVLWAGAASVTAGLVTGNPSSSNVGLFAVIIGLRLMLPVAYRRATSAWGLWRLGVELP